MAYYKYLKTTLLNFTEKIKNKWKRLISPYIAKISNHPLARPLIKAWHMLCLLGQYVNGYLFITLFFLAIGTQFLQYLFPDPEDQNYADVDFDDLKNDFGPITFFFLRLCLLSAPNLLQAMVELIMLPDIYGIIDEDKFSEPLKTQLRRNLLLRVYYLLYRQRSFQSGEPYRERDGVTYDWGANPSQYDFLSTDKDDKDDKDGCE